MSIESALRKRHAAERCWVYFDQCPVGTGGNSKNYLDGFAISCFESEKNKRICYEIKVSRADFLNEIKKPHKRRYGLMMSNEFYFVAPKGLLKPSDIPIECGLMEYDESHDQLRISIPAPYRESLRPNWNMVVALLRRAVEIRTDRITVGVTK